jgi:hypothetical protein
MKSLRHEQTKEQPVFSTVVRDSDMATERKPPQRTLTATAPLEPDCVAATALARQQRYQGPVLNTIAPERRPGPSRTIAFNQDSDTQIRYAGICITNLLATCLPRDDAPSRPSATDMKRRFLTDRDYHDSFCVS